MKISIIGTRGIPARYGGFETFADEISKNLIQIDKTLNIQVLADCDQKISNNDLDNFSGVRLIYSKYSKNKNPLKYYLDSILLSLDSDIILSCGAGGGYFSFIPKFYKVKFITNPDGLEWKREKWSIIKRFLIKTMEKTSVLFSDAIICDSKGITEYIRKEYSYKKKLYTIEYGAYINEYLENSLVEVKDIYSKYDLQANKYHLVVSRLEPENNVHIIIDGYIQSQSEYPLIIVGGINQNDYVDTLLDKKNTNIRFIGAIYDKKELSVIRAGACSYLHGHSVGGTNPSLLEAMGSKNLCICHDNIFNRETLRNNGLFFKDENELSNIFNTLNQNEEIVQEYKINVKNLITEYYNWENISSLYLKAFYEVVNE